MIHETHIPQFLVSRNLYSLVFGFAKPISPSFWFRKTLWNENFASSLFHEESEKIVVSRKKISKEANIETLDTIATITLYIFSCDLQFNKYIYSYQKKELLNREKNCLDFHRTFCQNYITVCHLILLFVLRKQRLQ